MKVLLPMAFLWTVCIATNVASELPQGVANCRDSINQQNCKDLCVGEGWFSKVGGGKVDARQICKDQGYEDISNEYGGNHRRLCGYPGKKFGSPYSKWTEWNFNKQGTTHTWRCSGEGDTPTNSPSGTTPSSQCRDNLWRCDNGECIHPSRLCNDYPDCEDGSDESISNCPSKTTPTNSPPDSTPSSQCRNDDWLCDNGIECIPSSYLCDSYEGGPDCRDGSDESDKHCSQGVRSNIDNLLKEKKVVLITLSYCGPCKRVKRLLAGYNIPKENMEIVDIDLKLNDEDRDEIVQYMMELTGAKTFPRVFIGGKCIGGSYDTQNLENNGKLEPLLKSVGAIP